MLEIVIAFDVDLLETCLRIAFDHPTHLHERRPILDILENIHILLVSMGSACTLRWLCRSLRACQESRFIDNTYQVKVHGNPCVFTNQYGCEFHLLRNSIRAPNHEPK